MGCGTSIAVVTQAPTMSSSPAPAPRPAPPSNASWNVRELDASAPVCVTGVSGFVASHTAKLLLEKGYTVRGTVRSKANHENKYGWLHEIAAEAKGELEFHEANLVNTGSYDEVVKGCETVMHIASPYQLDVKDPMQDLVIPARSGTLNVLRACQQAGVKRVVLTSSMAAVTDSPDPKHTYTEDDWNELSSLKRNPYYYSKVMAERAAWDFVEECKKNGKECFTLIVLNPSIVIGKMLNDVKSMKSINSSLGIFVDLLNKKLPVVFDMNFAYVDVRDVAKAHVLAMESADIESARHILQGYNAVPLKHVVDRIKEFYPDYKKQLPSKDFTGKVGSFVIKHIFSRIQSKQTGVYIRTNLNKAYNPDSSKLKGLGLEYYAFEDTLRYTIEWALGTGLVEFSPTANL